MSYIAILVVKAFFPAGMTVRFIGVLFWRWGVWDLECEYVCAV